MSSPPSGVELWLVDVARTGPALAALEEEVPRLSDDERQRFVQAGRSGEDWRLIRIALRVLLERAAGPKLRRVPFRIGPQGKPTLPWPANVEFSLSHSTRFGLIAIADSTVGVDLEQPRKVQFPLNRQEAMLASARALVPSLPYDDGCTSSSIDILQAWVRLEAWAKARGSGIGTLLHDLGIRGSRWSPDSRATQFGAIATQLLRRDGLLVRDLPLPQQLYGALASKGCPLPLLVRDLPADPTSLQALATDT